MVGCRSRGPPGLCGSRKTQRRRSQRRRRFQHATAASLRPSTKEMETLKAEFTESFVNLKNDIYTKLDTKADAIVPQDPKPLNDTQLSWLKDAITASSRAGLQVFGRTVDGKLEAANALAGEAKKEALEASARVSALETRLQ